ncbi:hypothetical protein MKW98_025037 [Papaver atlanticum]|uniref:Uncharacterized protein n=1 Tax=Papaver atlanticum TaxID=357466 RepID=A0AAD4SZW3_9MAGN|nr:hypothetical protein MKW98_025037 [Papaver atlanticum]
MYIINLKKHNLEIFANEEMGWKNLNLIGAAWEDQLSYEELGVLGIFAERRRQEIIDRLDLVEQFIEIDKALVENVVAIADGVAAIVGDVAIVAGDVDVGADGDVAAP